MSDKFDNIIVAGSLDDKALREQINQLVKDVQKQTNAIASAFEGAYEKIKNVTSAKTTKSTASDTAKKVAENKKERDSVVNLQEAYDKMIKGREEAMRGSARTSMAAFINGFKEQARQLTESMRSFALGTPEIASYNRKIIEATSNIERLKNELKDKQVNFQPFGDIEKQLAAYKQRLQDLKQARENAIQGVMTGSGYDAINLMRSQQKAAEAQVAHLKRQTSVAQELTSEVQKEDAAQARVTQETKASTNAAKEYSAEVKRIAAEIRAKPTFQRNLDAMGMASGAFSYDGQLVSASEIKGVQTLEEGIEQTIQRIIEQRRKESDVISQQKQAVQELSDKEKAAREILGWDDTPAPKKKYMKPTAQNAGMTELRWNLQAITGDNERWIASIDTTKLGYVELITHAKDLRNILEGVTDESKRESQAYKAIADEYQRVTRLAERQKTAIQSPSSLGKINQMELKTLEDYMQKLQALKAYKVKIDITTKDGAREIALVNKEIDKTQKSLDKYVSAGAKAKGINAALARSWNYMKNRLAFYFTVGVLTNFVKKLGEVRAEYELMERSIGILIDNAQRGTRIFNQLNQMALKSPYTMLELGGAAKQLVAYNIAADDIVDTTKRLADMAAAVGIPMERLTYALGQIKAYGYLNSRDARIFLNAGIPIVTMLKDMYNRQRDVNQEMLTAGEVRGMMEKKLVSFADVMKVVNEATSEGGRFYNFQEKAADTLKVKIANLTLAYNNMLNDIGKGGSGIINLGLGGLRYITENWRAVLRILLSVVAAMGTYRLLMHFAVKEQQRLVLFAGIRKWITGIRQATTAQAMFNAVCNQNPYLVAFTLASGALAYFTMFATETSKAERSIKELSDGVDGFNKEISSMYVKVASAGDFKDQLTELRSMIDRIQSEFGITIPIRLEEINERNIRKKLDEVKNIADSYSVFAAQFGKSAINAGVVDTLQEAGRKWQDFYEKLVSNITMVQKAMVKAGKSQEEVNELNRKDGESQFAYYERLLGYFKQVGAIRDWQRLSAGQQFQQNKKNDALLKSFNLTGKESLKIISSIQTAYDKMASSSKQLEKPFENLKEDLEKSIDVSKIPQEQRTLKIGAAIDKLAADNSLSEASVYLLKQWAQIHWGLPFGFAIDKPSEKKAELELTEWQKKMQKKANSLGIKFNVEVEFASEISELDYAGKKLQEYKDAKEKYETQQRKLKAGTSNQTMVDAAKEAMNEAREVARLAGADLDSVDKENKGRGNTKDVVLDLLKKEISLVNDLQDAYEKLSKTPMTEEDKLKTVREAFGKTLPRINAELRKYKLPDLTTMIIQGKDRSVTLNHFKNTLNSLVKRGLLTLERSQELEAVLQKLTVSVKEVDYSDITKHIEDGLSRLKDSFQISMDIEADPEMGGILSSVFKVDLDKLPKSAREYADQIKDVLNDAIKEVNKKGNTKFSLLSSDDILSLKSDDIKKTFGENNELTKAIINGTKEAQSAVKKTFSDTNKMLSDYLSKYGDLPTKVGEIEERKLKNLKDLNDAYNTEDLRKTYDYAVKKKAIEEMARKELGEAKFDDFKNDPMYVTFFEDLGKASTRTLELMKKRLDEVKEGMHDLTPEQLKTITEQYSKLDDELLKRNPFRELNKSIKDGVKALKERKRLQQELVEADDAVRGQKEVVAILVKQKKQMEANGERSSEEYYETQARLNEENTILAILLKQYAALQKQNQENDLAIKLLSKKGAAIAGKVATNLSSLSTLRDNFKEIGVEFGDTADAVIDGLSTAGNGLNDAVSAASSGDVVGAVAGVVKMAGGIGDAVASLFGDGAARTKRINKEIKASEERVRKLKLSYMDLERAAEKAMGTQETRAKRLAIANSEAQLSELRKQKQLEESKRKKDRDDDKIKAYEEQIKQLENTIADAKEEIMNSLLGQDVKSAAEAFVDSWVDAWKSGENTLEAITKNMDDMIQTVIKKALSSAIAGRWLQPIYNELDKATKAGSQGDEELTIDEAKKIADLAKERTAGMNKELLMLYSMLEERGILAKDKETNLSNLQQGIQSITEDTAGALEAYMNGVSQQVYFQSDLLAQIRDTMQGFDANAQLGTLSEMLFQLQQSYQSQMAIQSMLEGWSNASGNAVKVELIS